jgi:hypothetical protein
MNGTPPWDDPDVEIVGVTRANNQTALTSTPSYWWVFWVRDGKDLTRTQVPGSDIPDIKP